MPTAEQVLAVARSQIGTVEDSQGRQKYGAFYGMDGVAWCAEFQWWCFNQVPGAAALIPKTAYTPTFYQWFVNRGQASKTARVGSLVFYDWPDSIKRVQHVGIVESIPAPGQIITIEGNTTSGAAGNQSAGGGVWRRRRTTSAVVGFGHPAYASAPPTNVTLVPTSHGGFLMALNDQQQADLYSAVMTLFAQVTGDEDGAGKDGFGWPTWRHDGGPALTMVDLMRSADRELNSRLGLGDRPGVDTDTLFGHVLSMRAELRKATADMTGRLARIEQSLKTAGVDPAIIQAAFAAAFGGGLEITGTAAPKRP